MSEEKETKDTQSGADNTQNERDYEAEARKEGWVSQEEWTAKGKDASLHKSAEEFVKAGERIVPLLKSRLTRIEKKYAALEESTAKERKATLEAMKHQAEVNEAKLKEALKTAVTKGDGDAVVDLQDKIADVRDQKNDIKRELEAKPAQGADPAFVQFLEDNSWYSTDKDLAAEADAIGASLFKSSEGKMPLDELFEKVAAKVKKLNPEKFGRKPASPDSSSRSGGDNGSKSKGVPKDVKAQFERMAALVPSADRKKFMETAIANYTANQE